MYGYGSGNMTVSQRRNIECISKRVLDAKQRENLLEIINGFTVVQAKNTIRRLKRLEERLENAGN